MPKGTDFISARCKAMNIAEAMQTAFWMESYGHNEVVDMQVESARDGIISLCELFGIEVKATSSEASA